MRRLLAVLLLSTAACFTTNGASKNAIPLVRVRAETDLDCPGAQIRVEQQLGGRFKAIGCGHKATYTATCDGLQCDVRGEGDAPAGWRDRPDQEALPGTSP